jgi:glycosyltransferase involved in cell wall biosynthesis
MTFSICIPHYGKQTFLAEAISSAIAQTISPSEIIVSLDSPVDDEFRQQFEASFPIRWVENQTSGIPSNWNNAVANATGDYVVLLHSDDVLAPDYLHAISRLRKRKPESAAWFCGVNVIDENGVPTWTVGDWVKRLITPRRYTYDLHGDRGLSKLLFGCFIYCPTVCFRRDVFRQFNFDERWSMVPDLALYSSLLEAGHNITGTNEQAFYYRRHTEATTQKLTRTLDRFSEEWRFYNELRRTLDRSLWPKAVTHAKYKIMLRLNCGFECAKALIKLDLRRAVRLVKQILTP